MKKIWKNRNFILSIAAIILALIYINKLKSENDRMRAVLPHMLVGDSINYFDLISTDAIEIDSTEINSNSIAAIFIFESSCSHCSGMSGMIKIWNKISKFSNHYNLNTYGIVLDTIENVIPLAEEKSIRFNLFAPRDIKKFKEQFKTRFNLSQTILCKNGQVIYLKLGQLDSEDYSTITKLIIRR